MDRGNVYSHGGVFVRLSSRVAFKIFKNVKEQNGQDE